MKRKTLPLIALIAVLTLVSSGLSVAAPSAPADWQSKVDPWVLNTARSEGQTEFLVFLAQQADLSAAADPPHQTGEGHLCLRDPHPPGRRNPGTGAGRIARQRSGASPLLGGQHGLGARRDGHRGSHGPPG